MTAHEITNSLSLDSSLNIGYNYKLFREQSASGQRKKQTTLLLYLPIPLDCTPIFTN